MDWRIYIHVSSAAIGKYCSRGFLCSRFLAWQSARHDFNVYLFLLLLLIVDFHAQHNARYCWIRPNRRITITILFFLAVLILFVFHLIIAVALSIFIFSVLPPRHYYPSLPTFSLLLLTSILSILHHISLIELRVRTQYLGLHAHEPKLQIVARQKPQAFAHPHERHVRGIVPRPAVLGIHVISIARI
ncbi:hypothetical protein M434DRAFT_37944 [Hypoxylon sp. CO27-5]|nr:hypothetical protein M434DRAFT_37944 [Hypoxylon sp. CO27-5]